MGNMTWKLRADELRPIEVPSLPDQMSGKDVFEVAKDISKWNSKRERRVRNEIRRGSIFWDPEDPAGALKERREFLRKATLDRLAPDRVCPVCGEIKIGSRQWVICKNIHALCLSCYRVCLARERLAERKAVQIPLSGILVAKNVEIKVRFNVDGTKMRAARLAAGVAVREVARHLQRHPTNATSGEVTTFENNRTVWTSPERLIRILDAYAKCGVTVTGRDCLQDSPQDA